MTTRDTLLKCSIAAWTVGACDFLGFLAYARHWWGATCWKMCCVHVREGGGGVCGRGGGDRCLKFIKVLAIALNTILPLRVHKAFQLSCILSDPRKHHTAVVPVCSLTSRNHEAE